ncbi:MAG: hypothetical protein DMF74_19275 [Acidobacteria bacterium]|nr:MAG: hypothetical protein DMF74_19275 [Acidobacteriota bacterium]
MEKQMNKQLPRMDSIHELAQFWDTHDLTDFADELEEIIEPVFERQTVVEVHLSPQEAKKVEGIARVRGIDPAALIHEWVSEKSKALS